jgi:hypothetical protein
VTLERAGYRTRDHVLQAARTRPGTASADMGRDRRDGIGAAIGKAAVAARTPVPVTGGDLPGGPAGRARSGGPAPAAVARGADPQAAIALHQLPRVTAMSAPGQDQLPGSSRLQLPDQQPDLRRALGPPPGCEQAGVIAQRRGQAALLSAGRGSPPDRRRDHVPAQGGLGFTDDAGDHRTGVGQVTRRNRVRSVPAWAGTRRRQARDHRLRWLSSSSSSPRERRPAR